MKWKGGKFSGKDCLECQIQIQAVQLLEGKLGPDWNTFQMQSEPLFPDGVANRHFCVVVF